VPAIFRWIEEAGQVSEEDMFRTFNMGVGMVIAVPAEEAKEAVRVAQELGERAFVIGRVAEGPREVVWA
jgi:phosphoribosylformylglycinamidine cyclo-ligase